MIYTVPFTKVVVGWKWLPCLSLIGYQSLTQATPKDEERKLSIIFCATTKKNILSNQFKREDVFLEMEPSFVLTCVCPSVDGLVGDLRDDKAKLCFKINLNVFDINEKYSAGAQKGF